LNDARDKGRIAAGQKFGASLHHAIGDELVGEWKFDGNTDDTSGWGNDGNFLGEIVETYGDGVFEEALFFDGVDDYVLTDSLMFSPRTETLSLWIYPKSSGIIVQELGQHSLGGYHYAKIGLRTDNELKGYIWNIGSGTGVSFGNISLNKWYHVVLSYDDDNSVVKAYLNGEFKDSISGNRTPPSTQYLTFAAASGQTCGGVFDDADYFNGQIDNARIYSKVLTSAQIQKHYAEGLADHQTLASN
ncbi:MAG: LamG domain-containing protein, partial [Candidatus Heimdallarchaeota archaeon]|nr:LamG domain-containing protein [Candidatus Heimdallarchaeota archaeon]